MSGDGETQSEFALITATSALMPGTRLTYHLEETELRESVEEALYRDDDLVVARTETGERDAELPEIATRAEIVDAARPHQSRLMAVIGGVERIRIDDTAASDVQVECSPVEQTSEEGRPSEIRAGDVLGVLQRLADKGVEMASVVRSDLGEASPSRVADVVASVAFDQPERHQELLEERDVLERLDRVERQLNQLLEQFDDE